MVTAPGSGAEIIPFLKTYLNLPLAIGFTVVYTKVRCTPPLPPYIVLGRAAGACVRPGAPGAAVGLSQPLQAYCARKLTVVRCPPSSSFPPRSWPTC